MSSNGIREAKKIKQVEVIENNYDALMLLIKLFQGQALNIDFKEFCLAFHICETENEYNGLIKNIKKNGLIRYKKFRGETQNVIIACNPLTNYFEDKPIKYSVETIIRNSYISYYIINRYQSVRDMKKLVNFIKKKTTFMSSKRVVQSCYPKFIGLTKDGENAKLEAIYREEKRKRYLKHTKNNEVLKDVNLEHDYTLQTARERDIFFVKDSEYYTIILMDTKNQFSLSKVSEKIAVAIYLLSYQVSLNISDFKKLNVTILVRDENSRKKLKDNFILKYSEGEKVNVDKSINEKAKKIYNKMRVNFYYESEKNNIYTLKNSFNSNSESFEELEIVIANANTEEKHNSSIKASRLVEYRENIQKQQIREEILQELREKGLLIENVNTEDFSF